MISQAQILPSKLLTFLFSNMTCQTLQLPVRGGSVVIVVIVNIYNDNNIVVVVIHM